MKNEMGYYRVETHLRLKPSARPSPALHVDTSKRTLRVDLRDAGGGPPRKHGDQLTFNFDSIIQSTKQDAVFNDCTMKVVEDVLCGYNGTVLAYGQSGSGKTYTMSGDPKNSAHKGLIPRAIQRIFAEKSGRPESETSIYVSYVEVLNEVIYDLLMDRKDGSRVVTIMEESSFTELKGLSQFLCNTEEDALKYFTRGERRRSTTANTMHKVSNRSHCMFTIYVERHTRVREFPERTAAKLNLVDLAGFERIKGIDVYRQPDKEILSINKSLTFLEQAVSELRKGQGHISFRQSRLTMLLKDALGGNSKTVLIVCILQEHEFLDETISSLRFAQRVRDLKTSAVINKVVDSATAERQRFERKIAELKRELALHDAIAGRMGISHDDITEQKRIELKSKIEAFVSQKEDVDSIPIESLAQIKETYHLFKEAQLSLHAKIEKLASESNNPEVLENPIMVEQNDENGVGELEPQGLHIGVAPLDSRPANLNTGSTAKETVEPSSDRVSQPPNDNKMMFIDGDNEKKNSEFLRFKHDTSEGIQYQHFLKGKKSELRAKKKYIQQVHEKMKECRREIHEINCLLKMEHAEDTPNYEEIESEKIEDIKEEELRERLENAKLQYQKSTEELKQLKGEIQILRKEILECQESFLQRFFTWYNGDRAVQDLPQ